MSTFEFKLPDIGEGVTEGEVVEWHVQTGDTVSEDDPMVEVMTDKATVTIGAPRAGKIAELRVAVGKTAQVGEVLVVIDMASLAQVASAAPVAAKDGDDGPAATAVGDIRTGLPGSDYFKSPATPRAGSGGNGHAQPPVKITMATDYFEAKPLATPATRKLARDLSVDLRRVQPSGDGGRVTKADVQAFTGQSASAQMMPSTGATPAYTWPPAAQQGASGQTIPVAVPRIRPPVVIAPGGLGDQLLEERKPFVGIRRKIAERMQQSKNTAAHFTFVEECNVDRLIDMRSRLKERAEADGVRLSYLPFIVKAVVAALKKHPVLNSALDEQANELVYRRYYHVGIAAATEHGLMVPVIRHAENLSILELSREIDRLGEGARNGSLSPSELSGSTFTITSLGKQGGLFATPVLNFPEVGILGVHQMKERPVVRDGEIVVGNVMLLSLSFDHRIVDGHVGAAFAYEIIEYLEDPDRLLLEMT